MKQFSRLGFFIILIFVVFFSLPLLQTPRAEYVDCYAIMTPTSMGKNSRQTVTFTIENQSGVEAKWVKVVSLSQVITPVSGSGSGWSASVDGHNMIYSGGSIPGGSTAQVTMVVDSPDSAGEDGFTVQVSDTDASSETITDCSGSLQLIITEETHVSLLTIGVSEVSDTTAKITATTNMSATSQIQYGTTTSYGSTQSITSAATSHPYTITGLTKNTTYHYQITVSASGTSDASGDQTFTTAAQEGQVITLPTNTPQATGTPVATGTPAPDSTGPTVTIDPVSSITSKTTQTVSGSAADNTAVSSLQYTSDNGKTWITIKTVTGLNTQSATFSFTPAIHDGTNSIIVRAKDSSGNATNSAPVPISIDLGGPVLAVTTALDAGFATPPVIRGSATDASGVDRVEYSLDGGKNWQPGEMSGDAKNTKAFTITPPPMDDGDYALQIRGIDSLGNASKPYTATLVIDRLPPRIGSAMLILPPKIIEEDENGIMHTIANAIHTYTVSVIGGANTVELTVLAKGSNEQQTLSLTKTADTHLWSTDLLLSKSGAYTLILFARDGGGHEVRKTMGEIDVLEEGRVKGPGGEGVIGSVTLYVRDEATHNFVVWDAPAYGQKNPIEFTQSSQFSFYPPQGTYYLAINPSVGFKKARTDVVLLAASTPITPQFTVEKAFTVHFGPFVFTMPSFFPTHIPYTPSTQKTASHSIQTVSGLSFPVVSFKTEKKLLSPLSLTGKTTLLAIVNTWNPQTSAQITLLESWTKLHEDIDVVALFPHESAAAVLLYAKRGGYKIPLFADPDGAVTEAIPFRESPTYYMVGKDAEIKKKSVGTQTAVSLDELVGK
jgi:hypothetical protein